MCKCARSSVQESLSDMYYKSSQVIPIRFHLRFLLRLLNIFPFFLLPSPLAPPYSSSSLHLFFCSPSQIFGGLTPPPLPPLLSYFTLCPVDSEGDQTRTSSTSRALTRSALVCLLLPLLGTIFPGSLCCSGPVKRAEFFIFFIFRNTFHNLWLIPWGQRDRGHIQRC